MTGAGTPYPQRVWYVCDRCTQPIGWREVAELGDRVICRECAKRGAS